MKILFSCVPAKGHYNPPLPLARAFARRGDDVAFLTAGTMASDVSDEGFEHLPAGASTEELFAEVARRTSSDAETVPELFAGTRLDLGADAALDRARAWQPDLIVNEILDVVGVFVATGLAVPLATIATGPGLPPEILGAIVANAAPRFEARGFPAPAALPAGRWLLDTCPDDLGPSPAPAGAERWTLRPEAHREHGLEETVPPHVSGRPRVLITLGSHFAAPDVVGKLLDDLEPLDVELVATTLPGADRSADVRVVPFQPLSRLLEGATAALIHGGAGTTLGCLAEGVPLVVWPQGADQPLQAAAVNAAGCGIGLAPGPLRPEALRDAVHQVLTDPTYAVAADRIRQQIAAMAAPDQIAADLAKGVEYLRGMAGHTPKTVARCHGHHSAGHGPETRLDTGCDRVGGVAAHPGDRGQRRQARGLSGAGSAGRRTERDRPRRPLGRIRGRRDRGQRDDGSALRLAGRRCRPALAERRVTGEPATDHGVRPGSWLRRGGAPGRAGRGARSEGSGQRGRAAVRAGDGSAVGAFSTAQDGTFRWIVDPGTYAAMAGGAAALGLIAGVAPTRFLLRRRSLAATA